jgi:hypothetical protein
MDILPMIFRGMGILPMNLRDICGMGTLPMILHGRDARATVLIPRAKSPRHKPGAEATGCSAR